MLATSLASKCVENYGVFTPNHESYFEFQGLPMSATVVISKLIWLEKCIALPRIKYVTSDRPYTQPSLICWHESIRKISPETAMLTAQQKRR